MRRAVSLAVPSLVAGTALLLVGGLLWLLAGAVAVGIAIVLGRAYPAAPPVDEDPMAPRRRPLRLPWRLRRAPADELSRRSQELAWALRDTRRAETTLRPALAAAADAVLLDRTERGLADDPETARRLLGDDLLSYLTTRDAPPPTAGGLDAMLRRLEGLR